MDLNAIIFPAPEYVIQTVEAHEGEIIFIPKKSLKNTEKVNERIFFENTGSNNFNGFTQTTQSTQTKQSTQTLLSINSVKEEKRINNLANKNPEKLKIPSNPINEKLYKQYKESGEFIPCLLLQSKTYKKINKNFLIFFHGNAEDIFLARDVADRIRANLSMNILIVEYPGYSIYKDDKDSDKVLLDCLIIYDFLTETLKIEEENIYVFGRSIGTSPALYLASKRKPAGLILMSPFTSVRAVAQNIVGNFFKFLVSER
jgi:abhydrolase domain-containing protein 17